MSASRRYVPVAPESAFTSTGSNGAADLANDDDAVSTDFDGTDSWLDDVPLTLAGWNFVMDFADLTIRGFRRVIIII